MNRERDDFQTYQYDESEANDAVSDTRPSLVDCPKCGQWGLSSLVVNGRCPNCPGMPDPNGADHCRSCGTVTREFCLVCWGCLAAKTWLRCEFPRHPKGRNRRILAEYAVSCVVYRGERKIPHRITACAGCQHNFRLRRYDELQGSITGAAEIPGLPLQLRPNDPYARLGGRALLWHPVAGADGVGSYLLAQYMGREPVHNAEKKRTYRAIRCQWLKTGEPEEWQRAFLFSKELEARIGVDLWEGGFFAIACEDYRDGKHAYRILCDGGLLALADRFNLLSTVKGEHYFTLGRGRYRFDRGEKQ